MSQILREYQPCGASHGFWEYHITRASHQRGEYQPFGASHTVGEYHLGKASQAVREYQNERVSHTRGEYQSPEASHALGEYQLLGAKTIQKGGRGAKKGLMILSRLYARGGLGLYLGRKT